MKTLKTIQTLNKVAKILCKVVFICCIVGFCGSIVGLISLALGAPTIKIGGVTLESIIQKDADMSMGTLYTTVTVGMILCAGEAVLAKFAELYFVRELADGTPFNLDGAKQLFTLGILTVCIPLGTLFIAQITQAIMAKALTDVQPLSLDGFGSVMLGVGFMVASLICRYGAEQEALKEKEEEGKVEN